MKNINQGVSKYTPSWGFINETIYSVTGSSFFIFTKTIFSEKLKQKDIEDFALIGDGILKLTVIDILSPVVRYDPSNYNFIEVLYHKRISNEYLAEIYDVLNLDIFAKCLDRHQRELGIHRKANIIEFFIYKIYHLYGYEKLKLFIHSCFVLDMYFICKFKNNNQNYYHYRNLGKSIVEFLVKKKIVEFNRSLTDEEQGTRRIHHRRVSEILKINEDYIIDTYKNTETKNIDLLLAYENISVAFLKDNKQLLNHKLPNLDLFSYRNFIHELN